MLYNQHWQTSRRKQLRNHETEAEWLLWRELQNGQLGHKFRRQFGVGPFILDFYCPEQRLGIEIDGAGHFTAEGFAYDEGRGEFLEERGIRLLRFTNTEVQKEPHRVIQVITSALLKSSSP